MKTFKDTKEFEKWIRVKRKDIPDVVEVSGIVYTMDEYDEKGIEFTYGNKRTGNRITVTTEDRYSKVGNPFKKATVEFTESIGYRIGICYED